MLLVFAQLWGMEFTPGKKAQVIGAMVSVSRDPWISGARAGRKPMQKKKLLLLFLKRGGRGRRIKRPRKTAIWLWLYSLAKLQSS